MVGSSKPRIRGATTASDATGRLANLKRQLSRLSILGATSVAGLTPPGGPDEMTEERITVVSRKQLAKMKDLTDWDRVRAMTEEKIERNALDDPDNPPWTEEEWARARVVWPQGKAPVTLRLDKDIIAWFKSQGRGYQTRINAVLRSFVEAQKPRGWPAVPDVSSRPRIGLNRAKRSKGAKRP